MRPSSDESDDRRLLKAGGGKTEADSMGSPLVCWSSRNPAAAPAEAEMKFSSREVSLGF